MVAKADIDAWISADGEIPAGARVAVHFSWLPGGRFGIENVANLDKLPARGATIYTGAPKHAKGSGGPARLIAVV